MFLVLAGNPKSVLSDTLFRDTNMFHLTHCATFAWHRFFQKYSWLPNRTQLAWSLPFYKELFAFSIHGPTHRPSRTESNLVRPGHQPYGVEIMTNSIQWESFMSHSLDMAKKVAPFCGGRASGPKGMWACVVKQLKISPHTALKGNCVYFGDAYRPSADRFCRGKNIRGTAGWFSHHESGHGMPKCHTARVIGRSFGAWISRRQQPLRRKQTVSTSLSLSSCKQKKYTRLSAVEKEFIWVALTDLL